MTQFGIGQSVSRFEDPRLLRGQGQFVDDHNLAGQVRRRVCWRSTPETMWRPMAWAP
jgi:CO/xanthine dehydrogenase Mo-binding subunit